MKSERRRNVRVAVQIPVIMRGSEAGANMKVTTVDLSEGGMAVVLPNRKRPTGRWQIAFTLPGTSTPLEIPVDFAFPDRISSASVTLSLNNTWSWYNSAWRYNDPDTNSSGLIPGR